MKTCEEITQLLSAALDRNLSFSESFAEQTHLMMCVGCRNYKKQLNFIRQAARAFAGGVADRKNPNNRT